MTTKQIFGRISGDGSVASGSGDFRVIREKAGVYRIEFPGVFNGEPAVAVTMCSAYTTANAVVYTIGSSDMTRICTNFTDRGSTDYADCDFYVTITGA